MSQKRKLGSLTEAHGYQLVVVDSEVESIRDYVGKKAEGFDYFVTKERNGDLVEVWAGIGGIPDDEDMVERVK